MWLTSSSFIKKTHIRKCKVHFLIILFEYLYFALINWVLVQIHKESRVYIKYLHYWDSVYFYFKILIKVIESFYKKILWYQLTTPITTLWLFITLTHWIQKCIWFQWQLTFAENKTLSLDRNIESVKRNWNHSLMDLSTS